LFDLIVFAFVLSFVVNKVVYKSNGVITDDGDIEAS